jgi:ABC-type multidrug transport system ATPase subunit
MAKFEIQFDNFLSINDFVFSYVNQDEALMGTLTVEEQLTYSAQLRLPGSVPYSRIKEIVCTTSNIK